MGKGGGGGRGRAHHIMNWGRDEPFSIALSGCLQKFNPLSKMSVMQSAAGD